MIYVAKNTNGFKSLSVIVQSDSRRLSINHTFSATNSSAMACAIPTPSIGEVPRPNSSMSTKEFGVAKPMISKYLAE
jgi:hypothetical protein